MAGIDGLGGSAGAAGANEVGADLALGAAAAESAGAEGASSATRTPRAKSLDMAGLSLASDLEARLAAGTTDATPAFDTKSVALADISARAAAIPRTLTPNAREKLDFIKKQLNGIVTNRETREILYKLTVADKGEFMAIVDALRTTPWKGDCSLLEKLMRKGVQDSNHFIGAFADIAADKLGVRHLLPAKDCDTRRPGKDLLKYFDCKNKQDFFEGLGMGLGGRLDRVGLLSGLLFG